MSIGGALDLVEHGYMRVEFIANLHTEFTLTTDGLAKAIELFILILEYLRMVLMELLVVHLSSLVAVAEAVIWIVAVGSEEVLRGRGGCVAESDRLA